MCAASSGKPKDSHSMSSSAPVRQLTMQGLLRLLLSPLPQPPMQRSAPFKRPRCWSGAVPNNSVASVGAVFPKFLMAPSSANKAASTAAVSDSCHKRPGRSTSVIGKLEKSSRGASTARSAGASASRAEAESNAARTRQPGAERLRRCGTPRSKAANTLPPHASELPPSRALHRATAAAAAAFAAASPRLPQCSRPTPSTSSSALARSACRRNDPRAAQASEVDCCHRSRSSEPSARFAGRGSTSDVDVSAERPRSALRQIPRITRPASANAPTPSVSATTPAVVAHSVARSDDSRGSSEGVALVRSCDGFRGSLHRI
mmetsp:Transcript_1317/g.3978  ORF Transcript_1317/g.3978 Transcript_1317/m.3978 type:complete len:318 (-) Transcript_1317:230-1183(-)